MGAQAKSLVDPKLLDIPGGHDRTGLEGGRHCDGRRGDPVGHHFDSLGDLRCCGAFRD